MFTDVNWWAVLVSAVAVQALGFIWYNPAVFGKIWMRETGKTEENMKSSSHGWIYLVTFIGSLVMAYILAYLLDATGAESFGSGALVAFWVGLGFIVPPFLADALYSKKSMSLFAVKTGYHWVGLIIMGIILAVWK